MTRTPKRAIARPQNLTIPPPLAGPSIGPLCVTPGIPYVVNISKDMKDADNLCDIWFNQYLCVMAHDNYGGRYFIACDDWSPIARYVRANDLSYETTDD